MQASALLVCACARRTPAAIGALAAPAAARDRRCAAPIRRGQGGQRARRRSSRGGSRSRSPPPVRRASRRLRPPPWSFAARLGRGSVAVADVRQDQREHQQSGGDRRGDAAERGTSGGPAGRGPGPGRFLEGARRRHPAGPGTSGSDRSAVSGCHRASRPRGCTGARREMCLDGRPVLWRTGCRRRSRRGALRDGS